MFFDRIKKLPATQQTVVTCIAVVVACAVVAALGFMVSRYPEAHGLGMIVAGLFMPVIGIYLIAVGQSYNRASQFATAMLGLLIFAGCACLTAGGIALTLYGRPTYMGSWAAALLLATIGAVGYRLVLERRFKDDKKRNNASQATLAQMAHDEQKAVLCKRVWLPLAAAACVLGVLGVFL